MKNAVKIFLTLWLILRLVDVSVMIVTMGLFDLGALIRGKELGFRSMFYSDCTNELFAVYIVTIVITALCLPFGFLVLSGKRKQNIIGFVACAIAVSADIVLTVIFAGPRAVDRLLPLILSVFMAVCLMIYGRLCIWNSRGSPKPVAA